MRIPLYQIDAFSGAVFAGNPAAVCPLESWPDDAVMQAIAVENNLSETAFFVDEGEAYRLRWFTPGAEVDLCGHATLATAHLLLTRLAPERREVAFDTRSGRLTVTRDGDLLAMDFPAKPASVVKPESRLIEAIGAVPEAVLASDDFMVVYSDPGIVRGLAPSMEKLATVGRRGVIVTAPGEDCDFVSRFFAPAIGVPEDPVTGSAHCTLTPYWSARLGKRDLHARQVSARGGEVFCRDMGERVRLAGRAALYMVGEITV